MKTILINAETGSEIVSVKFGGATDFVQCPGFEQTHNIYFGQKVEAGIYSVSDSQVFAVEEEIVLPDNKKEIEVEFITSEIGYFTGRLTLASILEAETEGGFLEGEVYQIVENGTVDVFLDPVQDSDEGFNIVFWEEAGDIKGTDEFDTLLYTLIFTDARATKYQVENSGRRRGWLGDLEEKIVRSRLWIKDQSRKEDIDLAEITAYIKQALTYMTENKICDRYEVETFIDKQTESVVSRILIFIGNNTIEKFVTIWRGKNT